MTYNRIFITGIAGFIGSNLAHALVDKGYIVSGCDNLIGGSEENLPSGIDLAMANCNDYDAMVELLREKDVVFHCAASPYEGLSVFSPNIVATNTFNSTITTLSAAIRSGVKKFIFLSSMARYGKQKLPFTEDMTPNPQDPYGVAKVAAEETVKILCKQHNIDYTIIVPHNVVGPRQKFNDPYRNVVSIMINRILQGKAPIIYGDGNQVRSFSYIDDCVECLINIIDNKKTNGEIINIGPDDHKITIKALAEQLIEMLQSDLKPIFMPARPCEVKEAFCSSEKAKNLLNYKCDTPLLLMFSNMISWIKRHGPQEFDYNVQIEIEKGCPETWIKRLM